ncbi:hypothetical protein K2173_025413 [Erythroxylum novogranatense]|uniref:Uncharacterized protein n=1 Tax=Erythroxylum novogranatense TaxID=1862640 RepID=A0AAV8UDX8_9ROSI|nr:hypothetical protein K2173_025413 [Erythroxylum novogranatense]
MVVPLQSLTVYRISSCCPISSSIVFVLRHLVISLLLPGRSLHLSIFSSLTEIADKHKEESVLVDGNIYGREEPGKSSSRTGEDRQDPLILHVVIGGELSRRASSWMVGIPVSSNKYTTMDGCPHCTVLKIRILQGSIPQEKLILIS